MSGSASQQLELQLAFMAIPALVAVKDRAWVAHGS